MTDKLTSAFILQQQLDDAHRSIDALRKLVDYTVAIIIASGGKIEVDQATVDEAQEKGAGWRHEADGTKHVFEAWSGAEVRASAA